MPSLSTQAPGIMLMRREQHRSVDTATGQERASITVDGQRQQWTFLTNHTRVLHFIAHNPTTRVQGVAAACRITERTAQRIVADLEEAGYLKRERGGQRTQYTVNLDTPLRHPAETGLSVRDLLKLLISRIPQEADANPAQ
ncbi:MarR family transcriptional regulator [Streptomyces sp. NPDC058676]|uniref:MarR family transcriptional regulator n=1 Tax=Streptomyces sp. NPDC058676 TaxID=3346593 RepID=UPI0036468B84